MFDQGGQLLLREGQAQAKVLFAGDLCPINRLEEMLSGGDIEGAFGNTLDLFSQVDLAVVNLEAPLCETDDPIDKLGPNFRSDPVIAGVLARAPVHVACLANNHTMDQGAQGLESTLCNLDAAGIKHLGASMDQSQAGAPLTVEVQGLRLALLNCATVEGAISTRGPGAVRIDPLEVRSAVCHVAESHDLVIPVLHTGKEEVLFPSPGMRGLCRELIDAGAAAVICHHPHVPQGIEIYRGAPIAYSLGNFLFDWHEPEPHTDTSFLLELDLAQSEVVGLQLHPIVKTSSGGAGLMAGQNRAEYLELLADLSHPLASAQCYEPLWAEQSRRALESCYASRLARCADIVSADPGARCHASLTFLNLLEKWEHGEILRSALLAEVTGEPRDPEAGKVLDGLASRLEKFGLGD